MGPRCYFLLEAEAGKPRCPVELGSVSVLAVLALEGGFEFYELSCTLRYSDQSDMDPTREFLHMGLWLSSSWNVLHQPKWHQANVQRWMLPSACGKSCLVHPTVSISVVRGVLVCVSAGW